MRTIAVGVAVATLLQCGGGGDGSSGDPGGSPDAVLPPPCRHDAPADGWTYPAGPYGTGVGDRIEDFTLRDCDGQSVRFGDVLAGAKLVLFNVAAGWCVPCMAETQTIEADVHRPYCPRGLRIVQVLFEDENGAPASVNFCKKWREKFGLTFPVLIDPDFTTKKFFPGSISGSTPLNLLVDTGAVIRYRAAGPVPPDFHDRIEEFLPE